MIFDFSRADDSGAVLQNRIPQRQHHAGGLVPEPDGQRFGCFSLHRTDMGQAFRCIQRIRDFVILIAEASRRPAVRVPEGKGAFPVIPLIRTGKLLRLHFQGECGVFRIDGGGKGPFHGFRAVGAMVNTQPGAPIAMQQPGVRLKLADIADLAVEEMKLSVVKLDVKGIHRSASSAPGNLRERSPFPGGKISKMPTGL